MNRKCFLFVFFLLIWLGANAQNQNLYYFKNNGEQVKLRDSADYLRIVKEPEAGSELFSVTEQWLDGTTKSTSFWNNTKPTTYEGQYISFFRSGKIKSVFKYKKSVLVDTAHLYYPNGKVYMILNYVTLPDGNITRFTKTVKDSTGNDLVVDGTGNCSIFDDEFKQILAVGNIRNGLYDGEWKGKEALSGLVYKEIYLNGKLISGESTDKDGKTYTYSKLEVEPAIEGGMEEFYSFLKKKLRYPSKCRREGIEGKVFLRFTVTKNGSISNIKALKSPDPLLTAEAVRVANVFPSWKPGLMRGFPVDVAYTLPLEFKLR